MPMAAIKALEGKLAEGVDAIDVLSALKEAGWKAPEGGGDYGSEGSPEGEEEEGSKGPGAMLMIGSSGPKEEPKGYEGMEDEKPKDASHRMSLIARKAMKKDGADYEA